MTQRQWFKFKRKAKQYFPSLTPGLILFTTIFLSLALLAIGIKIGMASTTCIKILYPQQSPMDITKEAGSAGSLDIPME